MIIYNTSCGLCNRIRGIKATLNLAEKYGHKVFIIWNVVDSLNCRYEELFELPSKNDNWDIVNISEKSFINKIKRKILIKNALANNACIFESEMQAKQLFHEKMEERLQGILQDPNSTIYIDTWTDFYHRGDINYEWLKPIAPIQARIDEIKKQMNPDGNNIGIHIRRTDMQEAIEESSTELFCKKINSILSEQPVTKFYLATDDDAEKSYIVKMFGDNIITLSNAVYSRGNTAGMQDAVVDLFCLAGTKHIYGSHGSSFTWEASRINNIPVTVLTNTHGEYDM